MPVAARLYVAWLVAIVATLGSLYFSEVRHFVPCTLCWYQRILMYPLVVVLGVASYRMDRSAIAYVLPLTVLGMFVSTFHYLEQTVPGFGAEALCTAGVPCSGRYIDWLGFVTIPFLALVAFAIITVLLVPLRSRAATQRSAPGDSGRGAPRAGSDHPLRDSDRSSSR